MNDNIVTKGYGESRLVNRSSNGVSCSDAEHRKNRRTEFKILGMQAPARGQRARLEAGKSYKY